MSFPSGMKFGASPTTEQGIVFTEVKDMEHWPYGSLSRRRGFAEYLSSTAPGTIYDLGVYDRHVGSTRYIDLMARVVNGGAARIYSCQVFDGTTESTGNPWTARTGMGWDSGAEGGAWTFRDRFAYYSDGKTQLGFDGPDSPFSLGLATPSGTIQYQLRVSVGSTRYESRITPGWYDWTFTAYESDRNVRSLPMGFQTPGTLPVAGGSGDTTTYYSLGNVPDLQAQMKILSSSVTFDSNATHWELWRRHPFDNNYRPAKRLDDVRMVARKSTATSSYIDKYHDDELGQKLDFAGSTPPAWTTVCENQLRWWFNDPDHPHRVYFSQLDMPENVAQRVEIDDHQVEPFLMTESGDYGNTGEGWTAVAAQAGKVLQILAFGGMVVFLCENGVWRKAGTAPSNFQTVPLDTTIGAVSRKGGVVTPRGIVWMSQQGVAWLPPGHLPQIVSQGWLDFDDADSPVRLERSLLKLALACYDPTRKQVLLALPSYGSSGNDLIICMDMEHSSVNRPFFTYWKPALADGEYITSMAVVPIPTDTHRVIACTNKKRTLYLAGTTDDDGTTKQNITWRLRGWVGARDPVHRKAHFSFGLTQDCDYTASIQATVYPRRSFKKPSPGETPNAAETITCGATAFVHQDFNASGNPFIYFSMSETASSAFELHHLVPWAERKREWPREDRVLL